MDNVTAITAQHPAPLATLDDQTMLLLVAGGDCSRLNPQQRLAYYRARCEAAGLDPRTQPFEFTKLNGKEVLYARKAAADGLASKHGIQLAITSQTTEEGIRVVTVRATAKDGRQTEDVGAVTVKGLVGDALCNALMKAVTKAKRRAILSLTGLGMLDETEVETVPHQAPQAPRVAAPAVTVLPPEQKPAALPPTTVPVTPPYVRTLWNRTVSVHGGSKELARKAFESAARAVFGEPPKPSNDWTEEDALNVESYIIPADVP
jgi:hypothetical protein